MTHRVKIESASEEMISLLQTLLDLELKPEWEPKHPRSFSNLRDVILHFDEKADAERVAYVAGGMGAKVWIHDLSKTPSRA